MLESHDQLRAINDFPSLVEYLRDELDWPIESESFDDLTFDFAPDELGLKPDEAAVRSTFCSARLRLMIPNN